MTYQYFSSTPLRFHLDYKTGQKENQVQRVFEKKIQKLYEF